MKKNNFGNYTKNLKELTNKQHMKTEIINQEQETEWNFPCLGKTSGGMVVLFTHPRKGLVLIGTKIYAEDWNMDCFTPITEPTTIKFIP